MDAKFVLAPLFRFGAEDLLRMLCRAGVFSIISILGKFHLGVFIDRVII